MLSKHSGTASLSLNLMSKYCLPCDRTWKRSTKCPLCDTPTTDRQITEADIEYCRNALQKAKVQYPVHALHFVDGVEMMSTIQKDGTVETVPLSETL